MMFKLYCSDCMEHMKTMDDNAVDAIITDPPYFGVKADAWDNQWSSEALFLAWIADLLVEFERILKPNGSLYFFASSQMAAQIEVEISKQFNVLNHITWRKGIGGYKGWGQKPLKKYLRSFVSTTEKIIFADKSDQSKGFLFEPLRAYIADEFQRAGMLNTQGKKAANVACGFSRAGGMASRHYFTKNQWELPTQSHYEALRELLNSTGGDYLKRDYDDFKREYENLRRPFTVTAKDQWGDVWEFDPAKTFKGKHPCEKPLPLLIHILKASTKPNAIVFDPFAGSGSTGVACIKTNRQFIGCEINPDYVAMAEQRIANETRQQLLFADEAEGVAGSKAERYRNG